MPTSIGLLLFQIGAPLALVNAVSIGFGATLLQLGLYAGAAYLASSFGRQGPEAPKPSDGKTNIAEPTYPRRRHYGIVRAGGVIVFIESREGYLYKLVATGTDRIDGIIDHYINDEVVTLDASGNVNEYKDRAGDENEERVRIFTRLGLSTETAYGQLTSAFSEWTTDHRGDGVSSALMILKQPDPENFTAVFPNSVNTAYSQVIRSSRVEDPRTGTTVFSENAALCIRDYLADQWGMRLDESWVENADSEWITAADVSDEAVPLKAGGSEPRWRIGMTYTMEERPADVLRRMLDACDGMIFPTPNQGIALKSGQWEEPTVTLDESAIVAFQGLTRGGETLTTVNTVRARYTSRDHDYQEQDADPWTDEVAVSEDGERAKDLELYAVPSHGQCRRLMKIEDRRLNPDWRGTLICNLRGLAALGKRFVRVRLSDYGIDDTFEIQGQPAFVMGDENVVKGIQMEVISMAAEAWSWNPELEEGVAPVKPGEIVHIPPQEDPPPAPTAPVEASDGSLTWKTPNSNIIYATRLYRAEADQSFAEAVDVSGRIYAGANSTVSYDDTPGVGTWSYWATVETFRGTESAPAGPVEVTVTA